MVHLDEISSCGPPTHTQIPPRPAQQSPTSPGFPCPSRLQPLVPAQSCPEDSLEPSPSLCGRKAYRQVTFSLLWTSTLAASLRRKMKVFLTGKHKYFLSQPGSDGDICC